MATTPLHQGIRLLSRTAAPCAAGVSDTRLLERFVRLQDEAAFELLAWRHGSMVLGTCRRVLRDAHEAEDVVQAVFLVLARRATAVGRSGSVGGWLHRVAFRLAVRARTRRDRRSARERPLDEFAATAVVSDPKEQAAWREVGRILDEEVDRLPEGCRVPFVLCCLEGRRNADVARELGCPVGTIESRLSRARRRLEARLFRRGVVPAAGLLATLTARDAGAFVAIGSPLVSSAAHVALTAVARPAAVAHAVTPQVAALADGALRAMWMTKLKAAVAVVIAAVAFGTGTGILVVHRAAADTPGKGPDAPKSAPAAADEAARIAGLITRLGSPTFAEREKAARDLDSIGAPALEALHKAAAGDEPERKKRAEGLVKKIESRLAAAKLLSPRRVRLDYTDRPLAEAVADFKAKSGYD